MKGTIEKINDNWMVILDQRTWQDPSSEDLILPLHIDDLWVIDHTSYILGKKQELNFQILTVEEGITPCGTHLIYKDYAKLILKENHIVDTNEMVSSQTEISDEEMIIGRFMNWFLKHYSTATIDGFFGYVNSMGQEVRIQDILKEYRKFNGIKNS